jgi:hypothetical protein
VFPAHRSAGRGDGLEAEVNIVAVLGLEETGNPWSRGPASFLPWQNRRSFYAETALG